MHKDCREDSYFFYYLVSSYFPHETFHSSLFRFHLLHFLMVSHLFCHICSRLISSLISYSIPYYLLYFSLLLSLLLSFSLFFSLSHLIPHDIIGYNIFSSCPLCFLYHPLSPQQLNCLSSSLVLYLSYYCLL